MMVSALRKTRFADKARPYLLNSPKILHNAEHHLNIVIIALKQRIFVIVKN